MHQDFCQQLAEQDVSMIDAPPSQAQLEEWVRKGACVLLLISTYRFDGKKEPHWIVLSGLSDKFFFFHDPHAESEEHVSGSGYIPVGKAALSQIIGFGKQKQIACVVITPRL
ncbi:acetyltransferase [Vibrio cholerae]|uniref:Acetyltransferase n=1 Tax=Vibrio cholerae TaxID=666 RepID=A0A656ALK1_VIBCL|nr:acetyltransferase domain protein [Vibrio cholerae HC-42A1]CSA19962.1 acetyltransferase [Vibrio cholerae]CSB37794.1 acetyltransferase [Vibrio cholerae]CSD18528.1 acetyltransferase [Vibrio cholerae]